MTIWSSSWPSTNLNGPLADRVSDESLSPDLFQVVLGHDLLMHEELHCRRPDAPEVHERTV
jgi:hypothetical protein